MSRRRLVLPAGLARWPCSFARVVRAASNPGTAPVPPTAPTTAGMSGARRRSPIRRPTVGRGSQRPAGRPSRSSRRCGFHPSRLP